MKELSCGFILIDEDTHKILACHPTGKKYFRGFWDIPKGHIEKGETYIDCAKRELFEETGFKIPNGSAIVDIGLNKYLENKDLYVYAWIGKIDKSKLKCTSYFNINGRQVPEINGFELVDDITYFYPKMRPIIKKALERMNINVGQFMLTNTADGIVNWLKENKRGLTFKFCNRGTGSGNNLLCNNWTIYIQEEANMFMYEIAEIQENKLKIYNRQVTFNGHAAVFKESCDDCLYLNKTVGDVRENDLEKFTKFYVNRIKWAKKLYKENLIKNICKETIYD